MKNSKKHVHYCVVDAFTELEFKGNPAAVYLLEEERDEEWLKAVVSELNVNISCFLTRITRDGPISHDIRRDSSNETTPPPPLFGLRWFMPGGEVDLCGHGTLASSHFLFKSGVVPGNTIEFLTKSGVLTASKVKEYDLSEDDFSVEVDFPEISVTEFDFLHSELSLISKTSNSFPVTDVKRTSTGRDILIVLSSGVDVAKFDPQFDELERFPGFGVIITGIAPPGSGFDFISRMFCSRMGVDEDPVCGSAHCALAPYWSKKLGKCDFVAYQASPRGGILYIHYDEKRRRVLLKGKAVSTMEGFVLV